MDEVVRLVRSGEIHPDEEIRATIEYLSIAISMVINIFNPSSVFVRGKMLGAQENLFQQLLHLVRQRTLAAPLADCRVHHASVTKLQGAVAGIVMDLANALAPTFS